MSNLTVAVSPHIHCKRNTTGIMLDVIIALIPAVIASVYLFGWRCLLILGVSVITCVLAEYLFSLICKRPATVGDLSAVVTGIILALNVPASLPLWQMAVGSIYAIIVVKCLFGGIGRNFANPASTARIMMLLSFTDSMSVAVFPKSAADAVAGATPLAILGGGEGVVPSTLDLFFGKCGGVMGETCAAALLLGGIYLVIRRVITVHTPLAFIGTVFVFSFLLGRDPIIEILTGGLMLGAIFMATDYATTPINSRGRIIFGIGCGIITMLIRAYGSFPEGVSFSILLMNILTPYIDKWTAKKVFGGVK